MKQMIETPRLILRPWKPEDAEVLYSYGKDPRVGPIAGWPPHKSVEESRTIIETVLSDEGTYAVVLKETGLAVGSVGLKTEKNSDYARTDQEAELGYWLGVPHWGKGIIPEAVEALIQYGFEELHLETIWCVCWEENHNSRRVQEKCGFLYHHTCENVSFPLTGEVRTERISSITKG